MWHCITIQILKTFLIFIEKYLIVFGLSPLLRKASHLLKLRVPTPSENQQANNGCQQKKSKGGGCQGEAKYKTPAVIGEGLPSVAHHLRAG